MMVRRGVVRDGMVVMILIYGVGRRCGVRPKLQFSGRGPELGGGNKYEESSDVLEEDDP